MPSRTLRYLGLMAALSVLVTACVVTPTLEGMAPLSLKPYRQDRRVPQ